MGKQLSAADRRRGQLRGTLKNMLEQGKDRFQAVLPRHVSPERMLNVALTAATLNPKLLDCSPQSVCLALLCASQTGLEPDGYHGHLVPYKDQCVFVPDYKGLIQLALQNGVVVDAQAVYENDEFAYELGTNPCITHRPALDEERGALRCAYAVARFKDGRAKFVVATKADCEKRKNASASKNKNDSPWNQWPELMFLKSAVKMLSKYLPRSPELTAAVTADDAAELGRQQQPTGLPGTLPRPERKSSTNALAEQAFEPKNTGDAVSDTDAGHASDPVAVFSEAIEAVETNEDVDKLYETMVVAQKEQLTEQQILDLTEAREVQKAVISGDIQ